MGRHQGDVLRRGPQQLQGGLGDGRAQPLQLAGLAFPRLGHHHQPLGARAGVRAAQHGHAPLADAGDVARRLLHLVGVDVAPGADDTTSFTRPVRWICPPAM